LVAAADDERRRLERRLHDKAQQRLVSLNLTLGMARRKLADDSEAIDMVERAQKEAAKAIDDLRELARALHPAILNAQGLGFALRDLAERATVPVALEAVPREPLPEVVQATAYLVVARTLAGVAESAQPPSGLSVGVARNGDTLEVNVAADDGSLDAQSLAALRDRVAALGGSLEIEGARVHASLPAAA
jgi:signal transduction histidine kinase